MDRLMQTNELQKGTRLKLTFGASDSFWARASQATIIEWRLNKHPGEFFVRSIDYQRPGQLIFEIQIVEGATKLWSEKKIVDLILSYNPLGFALIFQNAVVEFAKEKLIPFAIDVGGVVLFVATFGVVLLGLYVFRD